MAITIGTQLGSHEITALLGKGGMGEVYRARDTKLKREVAIKIIPEELSRDTDRVSRFQREAEVLASLNHPNIAGIYDLQEANGSRYLVLELVEGETLADRIARGPIPVHEALRIAKSIGDALEAAHEKGVIHRDLKPANVKITPDGKVKVLDFGLAKAMDNNSANATLSNSPTMLSGTMGGMILGTAAYMSPDQARGLGADPRSDIFAFGCVLFEMLAGQRPFQGDTIADVLASIMKSEPDWTLLPPDTPAAVVLLIRRCLQKDRSRRIRNIGDAAIEIDQALTDPRPDRTPAENRLKPLYVWLAAVLAVLMSVAVFVASRQTSVPETRIIRFAIPPPERTTPKALFQVDVPVSAVLDQYDVTSDGRNFIIIENEQDATSPPINIIINWFEELKQRSAIER